MVYPRACGGTERRQRRRSCRQGLSPRVRGNPTATPVPTATPGSIPARAGEPNMGSVNRAPLPVYPRACGGTSTPRSWAITLYGLSPRVRGNPRGLRCDDAPPGSIPARAGEPGIRSAAPDQEKVYPRACGGTERLIWTVFPPHGLSPRVRGNRQPEGHSHCRRGSIPARAGEPGWCTRTSKCCAVYPRACGGTLRFVGVDLVAGGSIPARAGEPVLGAAGEPHLAVYPRACGGTVRSGNSIRPRRGLSPRVRGNHHCLPRGRGLHRSIPARAGEPRRGQRRC